MKTIRFDETQLAQLDQIAEKLFNDESDPRSKNYKRLLIRPSINWIGFFSWWLTPVFYTMLLTFLFQLIKIKLIYQICIIAVMTLLYLVFTVKWLVICVIKIYQRFSPESVRLKCRFEPSCSQYMILTIQKYGLLKGIKRGLERLKKCNIWGGGFDEP